MTESNATEFRTACGGVINDSSKYPSAKYGGKMIYFCTKACLRAFEQAPNQFMGGEIEHPLEDD